MFNQSRCSETKSIQGSPLRPGDVVVVCGYQTKVASVWYDPATARTQIDLDWGKMGKSKIYAHDEGKTWHRLANFN